MEDNLKNISKIVNTQSKPISNGVKLCDICAIYHPRGGGIKTYIDNKRLVYQQRNIPHILLAPNVTNLDRTELTQEGNLKIYYLPARQMSFTGTPYYAFKNFSDIEKVLEIEKPDVIEIGDKLTTLFFKNKIRRLHQKLKVKIFAFSHERADNFSKIVTGSKLAGLILGNLVMKRFAGAVDFVIANSNFTAEEILKVAPKDKVGVVYLGINSDNLTRQKYYDQALYRRLSDNGQKVLLIHIGRLDKDKRIGLLIDIAKRLDAKRYRLVVVGGGSHEQRIKDLPAVEFIGFQPYEQVKKYLAVCDLGVLVNDLEPYGLVGLEMMAMGLPILGPNKGGLVSFMKSDFAYLLSSDPADYLAALEKWHSLPKADKETMSQLARREVEKYSLDSMVDQLMKIYQKHD